MAFADSSETEIAFIAEATFGTTPATPVFQRMRVTSEDLTGELQTVVSNELRPDAEVSDLIRVGESATGNLPFELSFGSEVDTLLEHALRGTFAANELKGATEKKSFTFEKRHETGATDHYFRYTGCRIGGISLTLRAQEIVTRSFSVQGLSEADVILRKPRYPESVFRGCVLREGVAVADALQCALDVVHPPARGSEQAQEILDRLELQEDNDRD